MTLLVDKQGDRESLTTCNGCGMHRLCRRTSGLWLCLNGPAKCWLHRDRIVADKQRASARKENGQ